MNYINSKAPQKTTKKRGKNNFKDTDTIKGTRYRLWVVFMDGMFPVKRKVYYGFMTKPDKGLAGLKRIIEQKAGIIEKAIIYERISDTEDTIVYSYPF